MTFKQFAAFMAAAKHLNITRAAADLHITQPSISKQLKLLQEGYRVKLFYKKPVGDIVLTAEGRVFLAHVQKILNELDALKRRFNQTKSKPTQPFTVGGTYALASELLPRLLAKFRKIHPHVNVVLRTGSSYDIHKEVIRGEVEIGLVVRTPRSKNLEVRPYSTHRLVAFVHTKHPFARNGDLTAAELARAPLILRGGLGVRSGAETILRKCGYKPNVVLRCGTLEAVRSAVRNKVGVGILSYGTVKNAIKRGEFKLIRVRDLVLEGKSFIVYHKERPLSGYASDFLALLEKNNKAPEQTDKGKRNRVGADL